MGLCVAGTCWDILGHPRILQNECTKAAILLISFPVAKRQIFTTLLSINILFPSVKKIARSDMLSLDIPVRFLESVFYGKSNLPDFGKTVYKDFWRILVFQISPESKY